MKIYFLPRTKLGKWSCGLIAAFSLLFLTAFLFIIWGQPQGDSFFSNLEIAIPMLLAGLCGAAAFVTGICGVIIQKERAVLVFLAAIIGFYILIFALGEFLFPH